MSSIESLNVYAKERNLPTLPSSIVDRDGMQVDIGGDTVMMNMGSVSSFEWPIRYVADPVAYAICRWLINRIENCSPYTVARDLNVMSKFSASTSWPTEFGNEKEMQNLSTHIKSRLIAFLNSARIRDSENNSKRFEAFLERMRGWYTWSVAQEFPGFEPKHVELLETIKAPPRKNGKAVMSWDPGKGPLTRLEEMQFRSALIRDDGNLSERVACWLTYGMGLRPLQSILLFEKDLHVYVTSNGERIYHLDVPRVKQRGAPVRSQLTPMLQKCTADWAMR